MRTPLISPGPSQIPLTPVDRSVEDPCGEDSMSARLAYLLLFVAAGAVLAGCPNGVGVTCPPGTSFCKNRCVYLSNDPQNCGSCGNVCPGKLVCVAGVCGCP